jgi:hypothetical protein
MAFAELWLPIIGAGICIAWAIGAWYGGDKKLSIWLIFFGVVCLLLLGTLQWQHAIEPITVQNGRPYIHTEPGGPQDFTIGKVFSVTVKLTNTGTAPAYNVRPNIALGLIPYPFPIIIRSFRTRSLKAILPLGLARFLKSRPGLMIH